MHEDKLIGIDQAKRVFQIAVMDSAGEVVFERRLTRGQLVEQVTAWPGATVGLETCGGAHAWARRFLAAGHRVRLLPAQAVKAYATPGRKTDRLDARAIAEAASRPQVRAVPVKSLAQQDAQSVQRCAELLTRQQTQTMNAIRGLLGEYGIVLPKGAARFQARFQELTASEAWRALAPQVQEALSTLFDEVVERAARIEATKAPLQRLAKTDPGARRLRTIPGVGPMTAAGTRAAIGEGTQFDSGRQFACWLGLTPSLYASGERIYLGRITRSGNAALRSLYVLGAQAMLQALRKRQKAGKPPRDRLEAWVQALLARKHWNEAVVALANKLARIAWAVLVSGERYQPRPA